MGVKTSAIVVSIATLGTRGSESCGIVRLVCGGSGSEDGGLECGRGARLEIEEQRRLRGAALTLGHGRHVYVEDDLWRPVYCADCENIRTRSGGTRERKAAAK